MKKAYSKDDSYNPSIEEIYAFADFLKEMEDKNGAEKFKEYAKKLEKEATEKGNETDRE